MAWFAVMASVLSMMSFAPPSSAQVGTPKCMGKVATKTGTQGANTIRGTQGRDVIVALGGNDLIEGKGGRDIICAGAGDDEIHGEGGADRISGGGGNDFLFGQSKRDILQGGPGIDFLLGMQGDDQSTGGGGFDLAAFLASPASVTVNLGTGSASGEGNDSLSGIEGVVGSNFRDSLYGNSAQNVLVGGLGDDFLAGRGASDSVFYTLASSPVVVDLTDDHATGEGTDSLVSIESAIGSPHDDTLIGTPGADYLDGAEGSDTVDGRGGADTCFGEHIQNCPPRLPRTAGSRDDTPERPPPPASLSERTGGLSGELPSRGQRTTKSASSPVGSISCPFPTGTFRLEAADALFGHGRWVFRISGGTWAWGPALYHSGNQWWYHDGASWIVWPQSYGTPAGSYAGGLGRSFVEAHYYNFQGGQWVSYFMGQCTTQSLFGGGI